MLPSNWHALPWLEKAHLQMWSPWLWTAWSQEAAQGLPPASDRTPAEAP